ncbi:MULTISPECIES: NAD(P)H-quinone oxidoreductase subunit 4 [Nostocales]|jgi:NAD(P)H-quinone oxidoreductase subunit 4|uniref:NAD(P)H-quinone oxidoreductase subunit 4 n=1 Tax=Dolichospermum flos-aquae UHCC 0037 TaxID=2590026 RepID=A0ACC7S2U4_DOLFA|nr:MULTISPECIES: NAD(P)H-quinone oxidoreductase subunit 4 [Nostocales]MBO1072766.1 NAD(P)H-quinone oxidoreductase subunit 4 [Dolichospermum sp. DEX189]MCX5984059.1 NAD(P)H-quinone oxidoreductase subunit 4 [Nostocales cyanobacterium LacPavin_0920_SED1_MAG_38_18]ALB39857.1 NAD(P)H-quinone oxidoreductase subunit 4 [Anabaena sp. WA102]MBO1063806.1 NAD(P)H-quinone oxidoreductase subunit 4 [Anabaena sp. 54]MTJ42567.1 NAD(P)H-quinone oxidoreductase subunit 4 [Dolichospermum flos-aquae UHCC 0037]
MNAIEIPWLSAIIFLPLVAALAIPLIPDKEGKTVRWYGLGVALLDFVLMIFALWQNYDFQSSALQMTESYPWIPQIGFNWSLGIDGLSMPLILLTGFINTLAVFAAWKVTNKPRLFYALMLIMYSAQLGVFLAQDLLMFFLMWEIELVPVYLLISIWGGTNRRYAATKFIIYTAAASIFILVAGFAMAFYGDNFTFNMTELGMKEYPKTLELALYAGFLIAYGVKLPIFPLHTWLPDAHGEASAPGSMILAGVLLKMGGYALIRFNVEMLTDAHVTFAPVLAILGVVNIVYGACCAFAQTNLKRRLAYSSIAHMGFVLIGIASYTEIGISGAVLQMVSHGLIAASLFFLSGVTYERTHTLVMDKMGGMGKVMPKTFALFTIGSMASLALPGMSGFVGELMVFLGLATSDVYSSSFKIVVIFLSAVSVILTPIYLLSMLRQVFYGNQHQDLHLDAVVLDIKPRELFITACLLVPIIGIGFYPKMITQTYDVKTVAVTAHARQVLPVVASQQPTNLYSQIFTTPTLASSQIVNIVE